MRCLLACTNMTVAATVGRCESYGDGRRILVDIVSDEVVYICFPKEPNGPCSFEEES